MLRDMAYIEEGLRVTISNLPIVKLRPSKWTTEAGGRAATVEVKRATEEGVAALRVRYFRIPWFQVRAA